MITLPPRLRPRSGEGPVAAMPERASGKNRATRILFLCAANSCRSQMAEGWARHLKGGVIESFSAGIEKRGLDPRAVEVMAEAGVDISGHESKTVAELATMDFDYVVTVCDPAREICPLFPGRAKVVHVDFDDPPVLAKGAKSEAEALEHYRRVRDLIRAFVETLPDALADCARVTVADRVRRRREWRHGNVRRGGGRDNRTP